MNTMAPISATGVSPRLLRLKEVLSLIPVSRSTFYSGVSVGRFPAPIKNGKISFWRSEDIAACIANPTNKSLSSPRDVARLADNSAVFKSDISAFLDVGRRTEILFLGLLTQTFASRTVHSKPNGYDLRCFKRVQARLHALQSKGQTSLEILAHWRPE